MAKGQGAYRLKEFYATRRGRFVRRMLCGHIIGLWPDMKGLRCLGIGYAVPYLRRLGKDTERALAVMPSNLGVHFWPEGEKGRVCIANEGELPFETESVDRIILVHGLEYAGHPEEFFDEIWRVLKSNGRLLVIVPNRLGFWARADGTPFGHGRPYSLRQIRTLLQNHLFTHERTEQALFMPPFRSFLMLRTAYAFESIGRFIFPGLAGVHLVEASKQIYAGSTKSGLGAEIVRGRRILVSKPSKALERNNCEKGE